jgi:hypothetical protein
MRPEMPFRKYVTGTALEVLFEMLSLFNRLERNIQSDFPWHKLRSVRTLSGIMVREPIPKVCGMTDVTLSGMAQALDHVCVEHGLQSIAWNLV